MKPPPEAKSETIMSIDILTFGCRLNTLESEVMRTRAGEAGLDDAVLVNTCAVTGEAVRQARQAIRRARRENPARRIIVTGCAAQIDPAAFAAMPEVDHVLGNAEKLRAESFADFDGEPVRVNDIMAMTETAGHLVAGFEGRARAFVQVQNGCDHRCTFCIIPYGRGNSRSVPAGVVVEQIRRLVARGFNEVVLTGVDLTSWGADMPGRPPLGDLVQRILRLVPDLPRLRISSIDQIEADPALVDAIASEPRLMPHLHLSLQAGDDMILKRMKRRHLRADAVALCTALRSLRPDIVLGADLIAGFPTESEEMFENTLRLIEECGLVYLHVFPYSSRPGTPAARMPQLPGSVRRARAARLRAAGDAAQLRRFASKLGRVEEVLMEFGKVGRTRDFARVAVAGDAEPRSLIRVRIQAVAGDRLFA